MGLGRGIRLLSAAIATIALALGPASAEAATESAYDLRKILLLADKNHPNILAARARLDGVRAQLDEAKTAPFSQFRMSGGVGLAPTVLGNNVFSPNTDVSLTSSLGLAWRASIDGVIPLWTFGKITNLWDAASANVRLNQATVEKERDAVRLDVRRAYFGLQLARDSALLLREVRKEIDKAAAKLKEAVDEDEGDPIELLKLQTYAAELEVREAEVERYTTIALAGLRFFTGVPNLDIPDAPLKPPAHKLGHVTRYLAAARLYRPELAMARAGIDARTAQVNLARAQLFPDIGIGLSAAIARAPEVANQINPFTNDPANYFSYGAAFVFQWKLDALPQSARIRFAEAQLEEVRALERFALGGAGVEVETAYAEVVDWQKRLEAYSKATSYARRWLVMIQQGIDVGTREEKEVLDPAKAYATNRFSALNATMELDLAMSRLAKATGWDAIAPDGL
ncbi:TolC family protein [Polyangium aurulentum]|uniref:TolC family protein n=1 Tax=Polyangium aurulentum TaxID=2567896 RepID=UPI0010ADEDB1|nr:TolC family protein [Polyangium aurulentum]UQA55118.1 TolC family protein [Polyangium aurulentum]